MNDFTNGVVVAAIIQRGATILLARRRGGSLKGFWEFPGGKIEPGEAPSDALRRELVEELGVESRIGGDVWRVRAHFSWGKIKVVFYFCELLAEPQAGIAHDAIEWVEKSEWENYRVSPADVPILKKLYSR